MRYYDIINEVKTKPATVEKIVELCQKWLDGGLGMTPSDFRTILASDITQDCRAYSGGIVFRGIAPTRNRCMAFIKTKQVVFAVKRPIVAYSLVKSCAKAAADFTKSGDEVTLVFKKQATPTDVLLDFTQLLIKLRSMGFSFSHSEDDDEHELWFDPSNSYFSTFYEKELVHTDEAYHDLAASIKTPAPKSSLVKEVTYYLSLTSTNIEQNSDGILIKCNLYRSNGRNGSTYIGDTLLSLNQSMAVVNIVELTGVRNPLRTQITNKFNETSDQFIKQVSEFNQSTNSPSRMFFPLVITG